MYKVTKKDELYPYLQKNFGDGAVFFTVGPILEYGRFFVKLGLTSFLIDISDVTNLDGLSNEIISNIIKLDDSRGGLNSHRLIWR